jgi:Tfp pilus assembly protein PilE
MQSLFRQNRAAFSYSVGVNNEDGCLTIGNGNQSAAVVALLPAVAVSGMLAAIAIPNFVKARATSQRNACINNLRQIDAAKQQWALEKGKSATDVPTEDDLKIYLMHSQFPHCPAGGNYTINAVGQPPECSIPDHRLP